MVVCAKRAIRFMITTTLSIIFSVTYYLELHNVVSMNYISHSLQKKFQIGCLDIIETSTTLLGKKFHQYQKEIAPCNSK